MTSDEEWVKAAMTDDFMVVELLVRLNHATPPPTQAPPPGWSARQRRSKPVVLHPRKPTATRASPTTPLSWSGATSLSCGVVGAVDGFEESSGSPPRRPDATRSKVIRTNEKSNPERSRKKKTLTELREAEILLLKERRLLWKELTTLRISLEKQRTTNKSLKRMKLDLQAQPAAESIGTVVIKEAISDQIKEAVCDRTVVIEDVVSNIDTKILSSSITADDKVLQKEGRDADTRFVLPDLNLPFEEDSSSDILNGRS